MAGEMTGLAVASDPVSISMAYVQSGMMSGKMPMKTRQTLMNGGQTVATGRQTLPRRGQTAVRPAQTRVTSARPGIFPVKPGIFTRQLAISSVQPGTSLGKRPVQGAQWSLLPR